MNSKAGFVLKVLLLSAAIAAAIKYAAPMLEIPATPTNALIAVLLPAGVMATGLGWRAWQSPKP